jgi:hypothetical protein
MLKKWRIKFFYRKSFSKSERPKRTSFLSAAYRREAPIGGRLDQKLLDLFFLL